MFAILAATALAGGVVAATIMNKSGSADDFKLPSHEVEIAFAGELGEGEMRTVKVGDADGDKVLIARYQGKLYATGNFCSHFGVPLEGGMLFDDKVLCPAHAAGFSIITGEPE